MHANLRTLFCRANICPILVMLLVVALSAAAHGQPSCIELENSSQNRFQAVVLLSSGECLGEKRDEAAITKKVGEILKQAPADQRRVAVENALSATVDYLRRLGDSATDSPITDLISKLEQAKASLGSEDVLTFPKSWDLQLLAAPPILNSATKFQLSEYLSGHCGDATAAPSCLAAYEAAKDAVRVSLLATRALTFWRSDQVQDASARLTLLGNKWDAYFNDARSQYPWELWINGAIVKRHYKRPVQTNGIPGGYREVPKWQLIVAHPGLALEYVEDAAEGSQQKETAVLEILGLNRWSYKDDGAMGKAFGAALIFTISDRVGVSEEAWGVLVHVNHRYSFGVTRHGSDTGYLFSADVAKLWARVSEKRKKMMSTDS